MDAETVLPIARQVDVMPFQTEDDETHIALRDPSGVSSRSLAMTIPGFFVMIHCDGVNTVGQLQEAFAREFGARLAIEDVDALLNTLDEALLLFNERYEAAYEAKRKEYEQAEVRDNRDRWPEAGELRPHLEELISSGSADKVGNLVGFIAPHLDYERGDPCYADAYAALVQVPQVDRYVILGTNHFGRCSGVVATGKDFVTPLGRVATDRACLERVEQALGQSLRTHEFDHAREHSIELQVHLLQVARSQRPFEVLSFLIPDPSGPTGTRPPLGDGPDLDEFIDALRTAVAEDGKSTIWIASADWSHIGQQFGDAEPTTAEFLEQVGENDKRLLSMLEEHRERDFVEDVRDHGNATRICSVGCMYALLRALPEARCRRLRYHQAVNLEAETNVTCAAAVLEA